ncbi:TRAP transporter substrate-binding protein [Ornithinibacillus halophilus]|uniref:TRAP-type C4-dicarboxylate transport system, substrate-binding protein n=1 Tax=Ornithinibacillus halophilus TaxID=930117 RepID=A0A1M5LGY6_9BACI|nr:TRAP transporter substrate-binding protein [Ornithinibacillus halophilus]SHG64226.1 TRAP-type C4-dicarboxylate transport system, substrate-binding protein [Ornithinibacillus halophilus]
MRSKYWVLFLIVLGLGLLAACGDGDSENADGEVHELDFSHFFPPTHFMEEEIQTFAADLEDATDGRVKITSYPGASLAAPDEHFDAAATGSVDFALSVHGYTPGEFPLTSVMELPFMADNAVNGSTNLWKLLNEFDEFDDEYAGTVPLWLYTTDPGQLYTVDKPVTSIEDLKGMKIRSPSPETSEWLEALGATPVSMPMNENFEALERGVVDGTIAPWEAVTTWGLDEVINYATVGNFYSTTMFVVMNEEAFDSLAEEDQEAIRELTGEKMAQRTGEVFDQFGADAVEQAKEKGVEIYELSESELAEWSEFINPTIENWINSVNEQGLPGQEVYDRAVELSGK